VQREGRRKEARSELQGSPAEVAVGIMLSTFKYPFGYIFSLQ